MPSYPDVPILLVSGCGTVHLLLSLSLSLAPSAFHDFTFFVAPFPSRVFVSMAPVAPVTVVAEQVGSATCADQSVVGHLGVQLSPSMPPSYKPSRNLGQRLAPSRARNQS